MSGWTADRLAGLHEGTGVSYSTEGTSWFVVKGKGDAWFYVLLGRVRTGAQILELADAGSIRVVSVPVDALLEAGPINDAASVLNSPIPLPHGIAASFALRAAVAHVTGESGG